MVFLQLCLMVAFSVREAKKQCDWPCWFQACSTFKKMLETMPDAIFYLPLAPILGFAVNICAHATIARLVSGDAHVRIQFLSFGLGMIVTVLGLTYLLWQYPFSSMDRIGYLLLHGMVYFCLGFGLFNIINANVSSLRVRMLKEYQAADPLPLPDAEIYARYPATEILTARLARLLNGGQIHTEDGRYFPRECGVALIGSFFAALRWLLLRKR